MSALIAPIHQVGVQVEVLAENGKINFSFYQTDIASVLEFESYKTACSDIFNAFSHAKREHEIINSITICHRVLWEYSDKVKRNACPFASASSTVECGNYYLNISQKCDRYTGKKEYFS